MLKCIPLHKIVVYLPRVFLLQLRSICLLRCVFFDITRYPPLTFLTYLYNKKRRRIPPITIVHPIMEPLSPMQSNSPLIIEKIQYIMYTRNRPRPTPNSSQKNNDIIFYFIIWCLLPFLKRFGFLFLQSYNFFPHLE